MAEACKARNWRERSARSGKRPPDQRIVTLTAWNEWTEGSYLEPDMIHGLQYLEAIREVFGSVRPDSASSGHGTMRSTV